MLLYAHILIALAGLIVTGFSYVAPSSLKLRSAYLLTGLTVVTGTGLMITRPAHLAQTCTEGLIYLGVVFAGIAAAKHKLEQANG